MKMPPFVISSTAKTKPIQGNLGALNAFFCFFFPQSNTEMEWAFRGLLARVRQAGEIGMIPIIFFVLFDYFYFI